MNQTLETEAFFVIMVCLGLGFLVGWYLGFPISGVFGGIGAGIFIAT